MGKLRKQVFPMQRYFLMISNMFHTDSKIINKFVDVFDVVYKFDVLKAIGIISLEAENTQAGRTP
jgi:negative regulator of replication initiation